MSRLARHLAERLRQLDRDRESGAAMVEFALVFPVQLVLTLMILQFAFVAHAHVVVAQAAYMGARAAAVADGTGKNPQDAAERAAARIVGVLTSGDAQGGGGGKDRLAWGTGDGAEWGYDAAREQEAYAHLSWGQHSRLHLYPQQGYVACELNYDYVMWIPVANHIFARAQLGLTNGLAGSGGYNGPSDERGRTVFRVHRVGFIPTPWTQGEGGP